MQNFTLSAHFEYQYLDFNFTFTTAIPIFQVTLVTIYVNHADKLQCLANIKMTDSCCDDKNPQTESCRTLVQEAKKLMDDMQQKIALLPDEMKREFQKMMTRR